MASRLATLTLVLLFTGSLQAQDFLNFTPTPEAYASVDFTPLEVEKAPLAPPEFPLTYKLETPPEEAPQKFTLPASLATPVWTWGPEASIFDHLSGTHGESTEGLSKAEAIIRHNKLHNAERQGISVSTVQVAIRGSSDCPGGVCPVRTPVRTVTARAGYRVATWTSQRTATQKTPHRRIFGRRR